MRSLKNVKKTVLFLNFVQVHDLNKKKKRVRVLSKVFKAP